MQAKARGIGASQPVAGQSGTKAAQPTEGANVRSNRDPYAWKIVDVADRMTGESHQEAYLIQDPNPGSTEELQVKATYDEKRMEWAVVYFSGTVPATGFELNYPSGVTRTTVIGGGMIAGALSSLSISLSEAAAERGPWLVLQVKLDNKAPVNAQSYTDHINLAHVQFESEEQRALEMGDTVDHALAVISGGRTMGVSTVKELASAKTVLVALPVEDGSDDLPGSPASRRNIPEVLEGVRIDQR